MCKKLSGLLFLFLVFISCHTEEPVVPDNSRTVLVYFVADYNLSRFVDDDIDQIKEGLESNNIQGKVVLFIQKPGIKQLVALDKGNDGKITENILHEYGKDLNSLSVEGMSSVFKEVFGTYPADKYALFLWGHGDGWLPKTQTRWIGNDGISSMDISELKEVLNKSPYFDFIFFDDCFMQSIEVAYELRKYTDYIFGCPLETPGPGAPYQLLMGSVFEPAPNIGKIVNDYYAYYAGNEARINDNWPYGAAISVIKCDELEKLAAATKELINNHVSSSDISLVSSSSVQKYDTRTNKAYFDLRDFVTKFTDADVRTAWENQLNKTVPYKASTPSCYSVYIHTTFPIKEFSGVSVYIPEATYTNWNAYYRTYEWYKASGWDKVMEAQNR
ncbi:MAG: clostripain-related cysteine peptidase [Parabacteroides sp.]|nr:clostripain-related cysteine peptidase [Parabacteroides sp.]